MSNKGKPKGARKKAAKAGGGPSPLLLASLAVAALAVGAAASGLVLGPWLCYHSGHRTPKFCT